MDLNNLSNEIRINDSYSQLGLASGDHSDKKVETTLITNKKKILTPDFMNRLTYQVDGTLSMLPPNCRYFEETSRGPLVVIEEPPLLRTITARTAIASKLGKLKKDGKLTEYGADKYVNKPKPHKFTLAFPYVVFFFLFNKNFDYIKSFIFLRTKQLSGFSDILFYMPLLNINSSQDICYGSAVHHKTGSLFAAVQNSIMTWWGAEFNHDYDSNYRRYLQTPILNNYLEWQYQSSINPMFVFNADWIQYNLNVGQVLNKIKEQSATSSKKNLTYSDMVNLFTRSSKSEKTSRTPRGNEEYLYYDICQSIFLDQHIYLAVGDPIKTKDGGYAFIYSFLGFRDGGDVKYIQLEKNGKLFFMKYTNRCREFILDQIKNERFGQQVTLKNGVVVKPKDILVIKSGSRDIYKKVEYIRKITGYDGEATYDIKSGPCYYLVDNLEAEKFDIKKPTIDGIPISMKKKYLCIKDSDTSSALAPAFKGKFEGMDISSGNRLVANFRACNTGINTTYSFQLASVKKLPRIMDFKNVKKLPGMFRCGRKMFILKDTRGNPAKDGVWAHNGCVFYENYFMLEHLRKKSLESLIKDDKFFLAGPDFDTEFSIGDRVVVANWEKPIEVLNVKTIQGFKCNKDDGQLHFILQSNDGKISEELYVSTPRQLVKTGYIRKVTNKFEKLSVGTKIIAKKAGISNFPKKDVNIIVAIIIDGPFEPLILCSNGCTLWYSTVMKDFQKITMKSKKWKNLTHVPLDISKIKFQAGDIINGRSEFKNYQGYILHDPSTTRYLKTLSLSYYTGYPDAGRFDKYFMADAIFECIPNPRISPSEQTELGVVEGYVDFHGGIIPCMHNRSLLKFINERGRIDV